MVTSHAAFCEINIKTYDFLKMSSNQYVKIGELCDIYYLLRAGLKPYFHRIPFPLRKSPLLLHFL